MRNPYRPKKDLDSIHILYGGQRQFWVQANEDHPNILTDALKAAEKEFWRVYEQNRLNANEALDNHV